MIYLIKSMLLVVLLAFVQGDIFDGVDMNDPVALMERFKAQAELMKLRDQEEYVDDCPKARSANWKKTPYFTCKMYPAEFGSWQQYCTQ
ncbi:hypothetical protein RvY_16204 [Ramazzottius varieornatus]|uniref:Uncharacterized protein n=1 Tax=Ramazzottius varieornatus TaxID=947166 RepID=A0A1D1VXL1_RAMVA|nr:hypothetical protein RvY_16204 [Ramazzottius varieornatus]